MKKYYYKVYDLNVESDIEMPELLEVNVNDKIDVVIKYGKVPEDMVNKIPERLWFYLEEKSFVFRIENIAKYFVKNGSEIIVEPYELANKDDIKTFTLGTSFGILMKQRNDIAIHGGTILINNKAVILTGHTGAGKSTLTNAFRHNGYRFLCDDVSVLDAEKEEIFVMPAYPQQKLCKDAMDKMGYDTEKFKKIDDDRDKYCIPVHDSFEKNPCELSAICEIELVDMDKDVEVKEVLGQEKLFSIMRNIYRIELIRTMDMKKEYFNKCLNIAKNIRVFKVKRPKDKFTVNEQIRLIEQAVLS